MCFKLEEVEDGDRSIIEAAVQYSVCTDQIFADGNRQDSVCVMPCIRWSLKVIVDRSNIYKTNHTTA